MIEIKKLSPSSLSSFKGGCKMQWFLNTVLGYREKASFPITVIGSAGHSVLEAVAQAKQLKDQGKKRKKDKVFGWIKAKYDFDDLINKAWDHHKKENNHLNFPQKETDRLVDFLYKAKKHDWFPENHGKIEFIEKYFSIPIEEEWAKLPSGEYLRINGIIDLGFSDETARLHYMDYKFGQLKDFHTGEIKDWDSLNKDIQLCLYYWAIKQLFPESDPVTHIWYVQFEKPFTFYFDDWHIKHAMDTVREVFEQIKDVERPECRYDWFKCNKCCSFSNKQFVDFGEPQLDMKAKGETKFTLDNGNFSMCDAMNYFFNHRDIGNILENCYKRGKK